ncbi:MAG: rhodanese-like domain-containing protein [Anaerolineae bacterium]|nr:rhodanese-like domain-containing protein [Anaerolineae bacterium]
MKKFIYLLCILMLVMPTFGVMAQDEAVLSRLQVYNLTLPQGYGITSVEDLTTMLAEKPATLLLDVRQPEEYEAGHLENSFNVPIRELSQNLNLLPDKSADIVVICQGGGRATLAATALGVLGYENVKILKGGFGAWDAAELPTTTDVFTAEAGEAPEFDAPVFEAVDAYLSNLPEGFGFVSAQNLAPELADNPPILIDVRGMEEWDAGYIDGAQHIWVNEFMSSQDQWPADKDANIVIYCASGYRGSIATVLMNLAGYTNVRNLSGGSNAWTAAGFPLVGGAAAETAEFDMDAYLASYVSSLPGTFNAVRPDELATELADNADLFLVDVRTVDEYAEGFIEGAVNIPLQELTQHLDMLPNLDQNIVVYCGSGHRSAIAMTALNLLGYDNVRSLVGGFGAWKNAELPASMEVTTAEATTAPEFDPSVFELVDNFVTTIPADYFAVKPVDLQMELTQSPPVVIDVRTDSEWQQGYIEGSLHFSLQDFMALEAEWPQDLDTPIVIYDNPTHRSTMAMTMMRLLGYDNVRVLGGGIGAWTSNQLPLVTD